MFSSNVIRHSSGYFIDLTPRIFHGYIVKPNGVVIGKNNKPLKLEDRTRRGGKIDKCVRLYYNGKSRKWTLSRLIASCFLGNIEGKEIDHIDRNTLNNHITNLEIVTRSENQKRWRKLDENL